MQDETVTRQENHKTRARKSQDKTEHPKNVHKTRKGQERQNRTHHITDKTKQDNTPHHTTTQPNKTKTEIRTNGKKTKAWLTSGWLLVATVRVSFCSTNVIPERCNK